MKTMSCRQLGGACDLGFQANTFEEIARQCRAHGKEMYEKKDAAHLDAIQDMEQLMQNQEEMEHWFKLHKQAFAALPDD